MTTTDTKLQRTPGKWHADTYEDGSIAIVPDEGFTIATISLTPKNHKANADFIELACNLHDDLVHRFDELLAIAECDANTVENGPAILRAQALSSEIGLPVSFQSEEPHP